MAVVRPNILFPNMTSDGTSITIPLTDLAGLSAAEADPATGNASEMLRVFCETAFSKLNALDAAVQPTQMRFTKPAPSGIGINQYRQDYNFGFNVSTDPTALNVIAES